MCLILIYSLFILPHFILTYGLLILTYRLLILTYRLFILTYRLFIQFACRFINRVMAVYEILKYSQVY